MDAAPAAPPRTSIRGNEMSIVQKFMDLVSKHSGKAGEAIDKAGDAFDRKTGGKYESQVDQVQEQAKRAAQKSGEQQDRRP